MNRHLKRDWNDSANGMDTSTCEGLLQSEDYDTLSSERRADHTKRRTCSLISAFLLGIVCGSLAITAVAYAGVGGQDAFCLRHTSKESPLTPDVQIEWHTARFNGSLLRENVFRQQAGPEVDDAWAALGIHYRSAVIPVSQASRVGLRPDQVKVREKYGGGFPANVEGLHQLHCLNLVRQALYFNVDYYRERGEGAFSNDGHIVQKHITHCLDIVRQQLMCTVDIGVLGQFWFQPSRSEYPEAFVDFNTEHKCRNFDDVRLWAERHQLPANVPDDFLQPPREGDRIFSTIP